MIRLKRLLKEAKQVGTLYHFTSFDSLKNILQSNTIKGSWGNEDVKGKYVSTTRDKNLWKTDPNLGAEELQVALVLDGDKLSNKYKIRPYAYEPYRVLDRSGAEAEELIMLPNGVLPDIDQYLLGVSLLKKNNRMRSYLDEKGIKVLQISI
jgi:hypothetical protein